MSTAVVNLGAIGDLGRAEVENLWQRKLPKVPMPNLQLRPLQRALAYELQVKKSGDINRATAAALNQALQGRDNDQSKPPKSLLTEGPNENSDGLAPAPSNQIPTPIITPGTVLIREWNGRRYQLNVLADGFEMDGRAMPPSPRLQRP